MPASEQGDLEATSYHLSGHIADHMYAHAFNMLEKDATNSRYLYRHEAVWSG